MSKLERFTINARYALKQAQLEAQHANHNYIGTEHLLLGLLSVKASTASDALFDLNITENSIRKIFFKQVGKGGRQPFGTPTLAPRVKAVIALGVNAAKQRGDETISTGHLMLGMLAEGDGMGIALLKRSLEDSNEFLNSHSEPQMDLSRLEERLLARLNGDILPLSSSSEQSSTKDADNILVATLLMSSIGNREKWAAERAAQEERNRIARDLHDSIKQQLFNIKVSAAAVQERWDTDTAGAKAALADVQGSAQAAMVEMNALLMQLSPKPLEKIGLLEALREQCQALSFRTGAQVNTAFGELLPDELLPSNAQVMLFRIAQEALANVARHARADQVRLRLDSLWDEAAVLLQVSDNGQGFEPTKMPSGMGLTNMRERVESLDGTIEIESQPDKGTTVKIKIPFAIIEPHENAGKR